MEKNTKTQTQINNEVREKYVKELKSLYESKGETVLQTNSNIIAIPTLDELDNEIWIEVRVSVPRGSKGEEYDGYEQAIEYSKKEEERIIKEKEKEEKKKRQIELNKKRREKEKNMEDKDYKKKWVERIKNIKQEQGLE